MITTAKQLVPALLRVLNKGKVPMIHGDPGIGKSDIIHQIAKKNNLFIIDLRMSQMTPTSLNGFGRINGDKSQFVPFEDFPLEGDPIPEGFDGFLLFLDELPSAVPQVQAASYKLILDKMIGSRKLHEDCAMVAAGNKTTSGAIVNKMGTAMQSRMVHFVLEQDKESWIDWGNVNKIDFRILAYVNSKPSVLNSFDPKHKDLTFTCGRTLADASDLIKGRDKLDIEDLLILSGTIGEGTAREFYGFCDIFQDLPTLKEILDNPSEAKLRKDPNFMFGVSSFVAEHMNEDTIEKLMEYITRFSPEFQAISARQAYRNDKSLISSVHMIKWLDNIGIYF